MTASLSALHVTPEPDARKCSCSNAHCSVLTATDEHLQKIFQSCDLFLPLSSLFPLTFTTLFSPHCLFLLITFFCRCCWLFFLLFLLSFLPLLLILQVQPVASRSSLATVPSGLSREDDTSRFHSTKKGPFHEIFNLPESERPLAGEETYYNHTNSHLRDQRFQMEFNELTVLRLNGFPLFCCLSV